MIYADPPSTFDDGKVSLHPQIRRRIPPSRQSFPSAQIDRKTRCRLDKRLITIIRNRCVGANYAGKQLLAVVARSVIRTRATRANSRQVDGSTFRPRARSRRLLRFATCPGCCINSHGGCPRGVCSRKNDRFTATYTPAPR